MEDDLYDGIDGEWDGDPFADAFADAAGDRFEPDENGDSMLAPGSDDDAQQEFIDEIKEIFGFDDDQIVSLDD